MNLNCDLLFMKQIVTSYEHHFKSELTGGDCSGDIEALTERLLIDRPKARSRFNHSLVEKINKLKLKEKDKEKEKLIKSEYEDSYMCDSKAGKAN